MTAQKGFRKPSGKASNEDIKRLLNLFNAGDSGLLEIEARKFIRNFPGHLFGHKALAASLTAQGRHEEALSIIEAAITKFPRDTELHNNRAGALIHASRFEEAVSSADTAIQIDSKNGPAYANKGLALKKLGDWSHALEAYHKAIELDPSDFKSLNNAGVALLELDLAEQAILCFQAVLTIKPGDGNARFHLAIAQESLRFLRDARKELEQIIAVQPDRDEARAKLHQVIVNSCDFSSGEKQAAVLLERIRNDQVKGEILPFAIINIEHSTLEDHFKAAQLQASASLGHLMQRPPMVIPEVRHSENRPLRIAYLSADFNHHATSILLAGVLEAHDREKVHVFAYSCGPNDKSPWRNRMERACPDFREIRQVSFIEAARQIVNDGIDILIDLNGYTRNSRLEICALRPAPVIVSWLGYPGTLGNPRLGDYVIGDRVVTPLEHQPYYSEALALMPHCYQPTDNRRESAPAPSRQSVGLPNEALVFCSFNQTSKITQTVFKEWCRLLRSIPGSVLWLLVHTDDAKENLSRFAKNEGVAPSRLVFAPSIPIADHLGRLQLADLALDTFPYGSHTTGSDALWSGVPLISILGNTFASRVSSSLLTSVGLPELITESPQAAVDLAIELARDDGRLATLRSRLRINRDKCPLFDTQMFARDLERMYLQIWDQHFAGIHKPIVLDS